MNMKKKLISGFMAAAMAMASFSASVASAADVGLKIGSETKKAGETFKIDVELSGVPSGGLSSVDFAISYDPSIVSITGVELGSAGSTGAASQEGSDLGETVFSWYKADKEIVIIWSTGLSDSTYWIKKDGILATISGTVSSNAKNGDVCDLKAKAVGRPEYPKGGDNSDILFSAVADISTDYTANITNGKITVDDGSSQETDPPAQAKIGDVDCNGDVNIADAILLARFNAEDTDITVTTQGKVNAQCVEDGVIDGNDLAALCEYLAGIEKTLPKK